MNQVWGTGLIASCILGTALGALPARAGTYCSLLAKRGAGATDPNSATAWNQNDTVFLDKLGNHSPNLCGPVAATHVMAGFGDYPSIVPGGVVDRARSGTESTVASAERYFANAMNTDAVYIPLGVTDVFLSGTLGMNFQQLFTNTLAQSLYNYGSFQSSISSYYSGFNPSNLTNDTMAEPICQAIYEQSTAGSGYDYAKTQYEVQLGFFSIDEIDIPYWYPCGDWWSAGLDKWCQGEDHTGLYTIMYDNGHFIPMSGVNPSSEALEIDNRQEGWPQSWQFFGSETAKIAGLIPIFDHAATLNVPGAAGNATIILGYNRSTVTHGGTCPAGQALATSGSSRGSCVPNFRYIAPVNFNLSFPLQWIGGH